jgi:hypothetical protein
MFLCSSAERNAINSFLNHEYCHVTNYQNGVFDERECGVPQGSSLSLFLSNVAAHDLDLKLEQLNGNFARFADDVVAVVRTYSDALKVSNAFRQHCEEAGLTINYKKSPGILLFGGSPDRERRRFVIDRDDGDFIKTINSIDFLGHNISSSGISLPSRSVARIKSRISSIIYKHLFLHRRGANGSFNTSRVGNNFFDWDFVTCINEIRKYIYGGLREDEILEFLNENKKPSHIRGLMGFLPLITRSDQLAQLDGWLANVMRRAQIERVKMLSSQYNTSLKILSEEDIISGGWYTFGAVPNDARLPSFFRAWRASRKYYRRYGLAGITPPKYYSLAHYGP